MNILPDSSFKYVAMIAFFCVIMFISQTALPVKSSWDFIVAETLTLISCLGVFAVVVVWLNKRRERKQSAPEPEVISEE